jgi:hypothetical protein
MENDQILSNQKSLQIIEEMVQKAKFNFSGNAFYFILWGVLLLASSVFEFTTSYLGQSSIAWFGWPVVSIIGGCISAFYSSKNKKSNCMLHLDRMYVQVWIAFGFTLFVLIFGLIYKGINPNPFVMMLAALPTYLTGKIIGFKPLVYGGLMFGVLGVISLFVPAGMVSLVYSLSMILGYIIPGFMMKTIKNV